MKRTQHIKPQNRQTGRIVTICLLSLFAVIFIAGACIFLSVVREHKGASNAYQALRADTRKSAEAAGTTAGDAALSTPATVSADREPPAGEEADTQTIADVSAVPQVSMDFSALKEQCPDIRAWLFAEGTRLDYPVVQTDNNEYYLKHLYNGERNSSGALFIDYRNTGLFTDRNTVIYGHFTKDGGMFATVRSYRKQRFYDEHPTMLLYTPAGDYLVELVCGTVEDGNAEFVEFEFDTDSDFHAYIDPRIERSTFKSDVEVGPQDKLVSLCTCSYERENARYMLIGKLTPLTDDTAPVKNNGTPDLSGDPDTGSGR